jgi:phage repressor protein C with HTH and peptisase S24 domain
VEVGVSKFFPLLQRRPFGLTRAEVSGTSMEPTLYSGERIWIRLFNGVISEEKLLELRGRVVLIERDEYPGIYLIKRLEKVHGPLLWIEGDNKDSTIESLQHDSRKFGWLPINTIKGVALKKR